MESTGVPEGRSGWDCIEVTNRVQSGELCIPIEEEFGLFHWLWFPEMAEDALVSGWTASRRIARSQLIDGNWPGVLHRLEDILTDIEDFPAFGDLMRLFGQRESLGNFHAHVCCDADSYLINPQGRVIFHQGYAGEDGTDYGRAELQSQLDLRFQAAKQRLVP